MVTGHKSKEMEANLAMVTSEKLFGDNTTVFMSIKEQDGKS